MISLIIVSYNTRQLLEDCLRSIARHAPDAEVIVVDNGSRDGSPDMVREQFPTVQILAMSANLGFAAANNEGLRVAKGDVLVLLNSDTVIEGNSLQRCADWFRDHPKVGALHPKLIGADDKPQECLYHFPTLFGTAREALRIHSEDKGPPEFGWLAGTALFLRREALESIGGRLDDGFWMYWEDADLSARLMKKGWELAVHPDACIRHYGGASGGGADATRRADLQAWYVYGKHRWFAKHRPIWETASLWCLDAVDVVRKYARGLIRKDRAGERVHAWVLAKVLAGRLVGQEPKRPGKAKSASRGSHAADEPLASQNIIMK
jgi:GT2 family glycosyltransferase